MLDIYVFASTDETGTYTYRERFAYRPEGTALPAGANKLNLTAGADNATTTALLELQKGMFVRLYCLANQTELVNPADGNPVENTYFLPLEYNMETGNLVEGTPSETDFQKLHSPLLAEAVAALNLPLPMVGSQTVPIDLTDFGSSARVQTGFKLTRTMARFDVSNVETDSKIHLESISMGNGRKGVSFFPVKVLGASPAADGDLITYPARAFEGDKTNTGLQVSAFYSYPSPSKDEGYLILKGTYLVNLTKTKDVTYQIPFKQPTADGGWVALEISNNHRYTIGITKADAYKLDFTLDAAEWDEGGEIDGLDPTAGSGDFAFDPDGIANAVTSYDGNSKTVTMLLAADSKFSLGTTANSTMSYAIRYAGSNKDCDWLEIKEEPVTKAVTSSTMSGTEHKYIISMKAGYTGGIFPRGILRFSDDATGKGNTLLVDALSFVPELAQSASDGTSSFSGNKLTLKAVPSVEIPTVTLTVDCKGGSKLAYLPPWLTVDKTESDLDEDTYKFEVKVDKDGFPTANPGELTLKFRHKLDALKEVPVTLSIGDEPSFTPSSTISDFESKTIDSRSALRIGTAGGTVTVKVASLFSPSVQTSGDVAFGGDLSWFTTQVATPTVSNNRRVYDVKAVVNATRGGDALYQADKAVLNIQSGSPTVKEYDFYRSAHTVTYPVSNDKQYTAIKMTGKDGKTYYWSPVNLGATEIPTTVPSASSTAGGINDITATCGLLFQWGRKYGFTNTNNSTVTNAEKFNDKSNYPTGEGALADMSDWDNKFIVCSGSSPDTQGNWLRFEAGKDTPSGGSMQADAWYQKLWNLDEVTGTTVDVTKTARKTPSDPCPAGWRVPTMAEWVAIGADDSSTGKSWDSSTHIMAINAATVPHLLLPAVGLQYSDSGLSNYQGSYGYYWASSVPSGNTGARHVRFSSATLNQGTNGRAYGFSVRFFEKN